MKIHVDAMAPASIVPSRDGYIDVDASSVPVASVLQSAMLTSHLHFVGYSVSDENVVKLPRQIIRFRTLHGTHQEQDPVETVLSPRVMRYGHNSGSACWTSWTWPRCPARWTGRRGSTRPDATRCCAWTCSGCSRVATHPSSWTRAAAACSPSTVQHPSIPSSGSASPCSDVADAVWAPMRSGICSGWSERGCLRSAGRDRLEPPRRTIAHPCRLQRVKRVVPSIHIKFGRYDARPEGGRCRRTTGCGRGRKPMSDLINTPGRWAAMPRTGPGGSPGAPAFDGPVRPIGRGSRRSGRLDFEESAARFLTRRLGHRWRAAWSTRATSVLAAYNEASPGVPPGAGFDDDNAAGLTGASLLRPLIDTRSQVSETPTVWSDQDPEMRHDP